MPSVYDVAALSLVSMQSAGTFPERAHKRCGNDLVLAFGKRERACMTRDAVSPTTTCRDASARSLRSGLRSHNYWEYML